MKARRRRSEGRALWLALLCLGIVLAWPRDARAYAWMIRHDYTACSQCHADPSGGSLLTAYGRAQGEVLLRTRYGAEQTEEEPGRVQGFLFGAFELPEPLLLGGDVRGMGLWAKSSAASRSDARFILMQADVAGQLTLDRFRVNGSLGFAKDGALAASVTQGEERLVSRVYWAGVDLGADREVLLRVGRMNLPFGLRSVEHTLWVRSDTRTDINAAQQVGLAASYNAGIVRGEVMAIAGNYQVSPDAYRERGYSAYLEVAPSSNVAVGASSLITHAEQDLHTQVPTWRQAHGAFARYAPALWLVLSAEADFLVDSNPKATAYGYAAMVQADAEPLQGLHFIATTETRNRDTGREGASIGLWGSVAWFFAPHADVRTDLVWQNVATASSRSDTVSLLGQLHLYL